MVASSGRRTTTHTAEPFSARNIAAWPAELPPPDDDDRRAGALPGLELGGGVVDAGHLVALEALDGQPAVVGAGGGDDGPPGHLGAVGQRGDEVPGDVGRAR